MTQIIPAIIAQNFEDLKEKVALVRDHVSIVQLDVMDGFFVPEKTFNDPQKVSQIEGVEFEVHLMVQSPEDIVGDWANLKNVSEVIFHQESVQDDEKFISCLRQIKLAGKKASVALNPQTDLGEVERFLPQLDGVLIMSVNPGKSGQSFMEEVIPKIYDLRRIWPNGKIEIDGGINKESAQKVVEAGANALAVGSYFFKNTDTLKNRIGELKNI